MLFFNLASHDSVIEQPSAQVRIRLLLGLDALRKHVLVEEFITLRNMAADRCEISSALDRIDVVF